MKMKHDAQWYIDHRLNPPKAFFDWCYSGIQTFKWTNKTETIVANEDLINRGCFVIEKRLTKKSNLNFYDKYYTRAIVLVTSKRIEVQQYGFSSRVMGGKQSIIQELINFERYADDEIVKLGFWNNVYSEGLVPVNGGMSGPYAFTKYYPNNAEERIRTISELRYLDMKEIAHWRLEHLYKYRQEIEFLQKIKANRLADDVYHGTGVDMRTINQKWLHQNKNFFRNSDRRFGEFELERRLKERNGKLVPGIEKYLTYRDIKKIPKGIGMVRFQNWVIKNKVDFSYYLDYLGMLNDLNIDPTADENLIIPKDLKVAHDNAVELLNILQEEKQRKEAEKLEAEYQQSLKTRKKLQFELDGYAFLLPEKLDDLIVEGKTLHHCVGSSGYVKQHKNGSTTILFVRPLNDKDHPFFTMEYRAGRIIQLRGKHNQDPPAEVKAAADHWLSVVNEKLHRKMAS